jgi:hypothetical protein
MKRALTVASTRGTYRAFADVSSVSFLAPTR